MITCEHVHRDKIQIFFFFTSVLEWLFQSNRSFVNSVPKQNKTKKKQKFKKKGGGGYKGPGVPVPASLALPLLLECPWQHGGPSEKELRGIVVEISTQKLYCLFVWPPESTLSGVSVGGLVSREQQSIVPNTAAKTKYGRAKWWGVSALFLRLEQLIQRMKYQSTVYFHNHSTAAGTVRMTLDKWAWE